MKKKSYGNALIVSCIFHLVGLLLGTLHIVQNEIYENNPVQINITQAAKTSPKRRLERRRKSQIELKQKVPKPLPMKSRINVVTTAAQLPMNNAFYTLSTSNMSSFVDQNRFLPRSVHNTKVERKTSLNMRSVNIFSRMPKISMKPIGESILSKITTSQDPIELIPAILDHQSPSLHNITQTPRFLKQHPVKYPELAQQANKEGIVVLEAGIGIDGIARDIILIQGLGFGCDQEAIKALTLSRFIPAKSGNTPVLSRIQIPYRFQLEI